jgi:hypothetical protein
MPKLNLSIRLISTSFTRGMRGEKAQLLAQLCMSQLIRGNWQSHCHIGSRIRQSHFLVMGGCAHPKGKRARISHPPLVPHESGLLGQDSFAWVG